MRKAVISLLLIVFMVNNSFALSFVEYLGYIAELGNEAVGLAEEVLVLGEEEQKKFVKEVSSTMESYNLKADQKFFSGQREFNIGNERIVFNAIFDKWKKKVNDAKNASKNGNENKEYNFGSNTNEIKKKSIGHANVEGKIWSAGDSLDVLNGKNEVNPLNTPIIQAEKSNSDEIFIDFGSSGSFRAPKDFAINNGIIHFKNARYGMNKDDEDGSVQEYIMVSYVAEIFDAKTDGLKFNFIRNGREIISENVSAYDYEYTTYIYKTGNITVSE